MVQIRGRLTCPACNSKRSPGAHLCVDHLSRCRYCREMKHLSLMLVAVALLGGCATNDFRVVGALRPGMTPQEAQGTITSFGFNLARSLPRPATGWPVERKTFDATDWRAGREEALSGK